MPTILEEAGFVIKIWGPPREHGPPHVHVHRRAGGLIVVRLGIGARPAQVWQFFGVRERDAVRALRVVEKHEALLRAAWERIHGQA